MKMVVANFNDIADLDALIQQCQKTLSQTKDKRHKVFDAWTVNRLLDWIEWLRDKDAAVSLNGIAWQNEIKALTVNPEDVVVLTCDGSIDDDLAKKLKDGFETFLGGVRTVVLGDGITVGLLNKGLIQICTAVNQRRVEDEDAA